MLTSPSPTATPTASMAIADALVAIACDFQSEWQKRFARPGVRPSATLEGNRLLLHLEEAFTASETELSRHAGGPATVRKQLEGLLDELYPWLAEQMERRLDCYVAESRVLLNFADESITYAVTLREMPRFLFVEASSRRCSGAGCN